jgi:hypothetical protein
VTEREIIVDGTVALTGAYGGASTHGDTLDLTQFGDLLKATGLPKKVEIWEAPAAGTAPTGYLFGFAPGTTQKNGVLTIFNNLTEYTEASNYSAGLLAATLKIRAWFASF